MAVPGSDWVRGVNEEHRAWAPIRLPRQAGPSLIVCLGVQWGWGVAGEEGSPQILEVGASLHGSSGSLHVSQC